MGTSDDTGPQSVGRDRANRSLGLGITGARQDSYVVAHRTAGPGIGLRCFGYRYRAVRSTANVGSLCCGNSRGDSVNAPGVGRNLFRYPR